MNWKYFCSARGINLKSFLLAYSVKNIEDFKNILNSLNVSFAEDDLENIKTILSEVVKDVRNKNEQSVGNKTRRPSKAQRKKYNGNSSTTRRKRATRKTTKHVSKGSNKQGTNEIVQVKSDKN